MFYALNEVTVVYSSTHILLLKIQKETYLLDVQCMAFYVTV